MNFYQGYRVSSPFGNARVNPVTGVNEVHRGIDLLKGDRADIGAFVEGKVIFAEFAQGGSGAGGFGNAVLILDKNGCVHLYGHLHSIAVKVGDVVARGQVIGKQGSTGQSSGSHLHYEVRAKSSPSFGWGTSIDPTDYLTKYYATEGTDANEPEDSAVDASVQSDTPSPKPVEQWKLVGLKYLQDNYKLSSIWKATDPVDLGTLGTILSRMKK